MSDRAAPPARDAIPDWRQTTDERVATLEQRTQGAPNGLIVPGGAAGTWRALTGFRNNWQGYQGNSLYTPQWSMDADGFVRLRGLLGNTVAWQTGAILDLPVVTPREEYFAALCFSNPAVATGVAMLNTVTGGTTLGLASAPNTVTWSATSFISLSGLCYYGGAQ